MLKGWIPLAPARTLTIDHSLENSLLIRERNLETSNFQRSLKCITRRSLKKKMLIEGKSPWNTLIYTFRSTESKELTVKSMLIIATFMFLSFIFENDCNENSDENADGYSISHMCCCLQTFTTSSSWRIEIRRNEIAKLWYNTPNKLQWSNLLPKSILWCEHISR